MAIFDNRDGTFAWKYLEDDGINWESVLGAVQVAPNSFGAGDPVLQQLEEVSEDDVKNYDFESYSSGHPQGTPQFYRDTLSDDIVYFKINGKPGLYQPVNNRSGKYQYFYYPQGKYIEWALVKVKRGGGGGFGKARSDEPQDYNWLGNKKLGYSLGLDKRKYIYVYPKSLNALKNLTKELEKFDFYLTNTPLSILTPTDARTSTRVDQISEILYFKKRNREPKPFSQAPDSPEIPSLPDRRSVPRRAFKVRLAKDKKRKQKPLQHGSSGKRKDGATVMYKDPYFQPLQNAFLEWQNKNDKKLPATAYAEFILDSQLDDKVITKKLLTDKVIGANADAITHWRRFFLQGLNRSRHPNKFLETSPLISTGQEWCHLYGHGDGGREIPDNFVCGTHYANTEQLAIETGQRVGRYPNLSINVTAYHLPETTLAGWIRYKIYAAAAAGADTRKQNKIFDHVYDGQSESFDYNQFKILKTTVERVIADALGGDARERYTNRINARIKARNALALKEEDKVNTWEKWGWDKKNGPKYTFKWSNLG